jgi:hypothetical protein
MQVFDISKMGTSSEPRNAGLLLLTKNWIYKYQMRDLLATGASKYPEQLAVVKLCDQIPILIFLMGTWRLQLSTRWMGPEVRKRQRQDTLVLVERPTGAGPQPPN